MADVSNSSRSGYSPVYEGRRAEIGHYFDQTAVEHWRRLTSDAKVSRIRESVRAGRESMQLQLLSWLPQSLEGFRVLDAGCGTGVLSVEFARRGATVVGVDLSPQLVEIARQQTPGELQSKLTFHSGDMLNPELGEFDFVVAMDSLIHYQLPEALPALQALADRCRHSLCFTFVPRTPLLAVMHAVGQFFPKDNRSPDVVPNDPAVVREQISARLSQGQWSIAAERRVDSFFYKSHALLLERSAA